MRYTRAANPGQRIGNLAPEQQRDEFQMDRALKERIIGVIVLVVFAVIIVPVFLDGPADQSEVVSESLLLPGQNSEARKQQTIVLDRDRDEPVPPASSPAPAQQEPAGTGTTQTKPTSQPDSQPAKKELPKQPVPEAAPASTAIATSETGLWAVQLGSFSNQENAERLAAELRKQGYAAFLSQIKNGDSSLHRVRIGPQKDRDAAEAVAAKLKSAGHASQVVPHP
jgi:DedD protein